MQRLPILQFGRGAEAPKCDYTTNFYPLVPTEPRRFKQLLPADEVQWFLTDPVRNPLYLDTTLPTTALPENFEPPTHNGRSIKFIGTVTETGQNPDVRLREPRAPIRAIRRILRQQEIIVAEGVVIPPPQRD